MDKGFTSFFKFVYKILRFILMLPIKIVKLFCEGFFYTFYVFSEIIFYAILFSSFLVYKIFKYLIYSLSLPVMIANTIKRRKVFKVNKLDKDSEIVHIPDNAMEKIEKYNREHNIENKFDVPNDVEEENEIDDNVPTSMYFDSTDDDLDFDKQNEEFMLPTEQPEEEVSEESNPTSLLEKNDIQPIEEETKDLTSNDYDIEDENKVASIAENISDDIKKIELSKPKKNVNILRYILLPLEIISFPVYKIFKYFTFGLITLLRYAYIGFTVISFFVYKLFKYLLFSLGFIVMLSNIYKRKNAKVLEQKRKLKEARTLKKLQSQMKDKLMAQQKQEDKLRAEIKRKQEKAAEKNNKNEYVNDKVKLEKKTFKEKIDDFLNTLLSSPKVLVDKIKNSFQNSVFAKDYRNKKDMSRQVLLINFEGEDAEKSDVKLVYQYTAKAPNGKIVTDYFEAFSKVEVHSFLLSEGYEVYNIKTNKWIQFMHKSASVSKTKVKNKDLIFLLTQLSTYIKAGIPLVEALKILARQYSKKKGYQKLFRTIIYDLTMGENFSTALEKQKDAFPRILINMIKASEMTGELPEVLDDMAEYFDEMEKTKKQMVTALMYPMIIMVFATAVIIFILVFVIPQFVSIYESMDAAQIPKFTLFILAVSNFLKYNYIYIILVVVVVVVVLVYLYKNVKVFRTLAQWLFMHMPVIGNVIIYNEVTIFTKTFSSLLSHNVFITDSMNILNKVTNNEIYKMIILDTITNLAKGEKISKSFENHWAFPVPAYEMLVTGEKTGQLPEMMKKVSDYYQDLHKNSVTRIKTFIEPILIIFLTVVVGAIVLAIVIPMFSLYQSVQNLS